MVLKNMCEMYDFNLNIHIDVSTRSMSVELAFCDLGENFHHGINPHLNIVVEIQELSTIVKEPTTKEEIDILKLYGDIEHVDNFTEKELAGIHVVLVFIC